MISPKDLELLEQALPQMSETERQRNLKLLLDYKKELVKQAGGKTFLEFIKHVYPDYKVGAHHAKLAKLFEEIGPKYQERNGGYTRITRTTYRKGDGTELAVLELV